MARSEDHSPAGRLPPPAPNPSTDIGLIVESVDDDKSFPPSPLNIDIFILPPVSALKLLCAGIEALVRIYGNVPLTPPLSGMNTPNMRGMQAEKENIIRSNSMTDLSSLQMQTQKRPAGDDYDGINMKKARATSTGTDQGEPYIIIGENAEPVNLQHSAITRKFYSKQPPPISLEDYLMRIHKYCPMSTGVYLATSVYIHRLAVEGRALPVTRMNCHRLVLSGLRVAMKALEDLSYAHRRFSKVGGVSEDELTRLEVSFCFLTNFELHTTKEILLEHAVALEQIVSTQGAFGAPGLQLQPPLRNHMKRRIPQDGKLEVAAGA